MVDFFSDIGAEVFERDGLLWIQVPEAIQAALDVPAAFCLTAEPGRAGEFGAELLAPGSYPLERFLVSAMGRGRWDVGRVDVPSGDWVSPVLVAAGLELGKGVAVSTKEVHDETFFLFTFRITMVSDEKRESFHAIVVPAGAPIGWSAEPALAEAELEMDSAQVVTTALGPAYEVARETLRSVARDDVEAFRKRSLSLLEEEVRRIFTYFDRTAQELREAAPSGVESLVRAVDAERDRRLAEALERYDARATASLCGVRVVRVPTAEVVLRSSNVAGPEIHERIDPWTKKIRGLRCATCGQTEGPWSVSSSLEIRCERCAPTEVGSARPQGRPRSDTLQRRRRAARGGAQSPRAPRVRSQAVGARRRSP